MRIIFKAAAMLIFLCPLLMGCGHAGPEKTSAPAASVAQTPPAQQPPAVIAEQPTPSQPPQPEPAAQKPAAPVTKQATPKDVLVMKGSPLGAVKFEHKLHAQARSIKCEVCHHASKPEKPARAAQQACSVCHTKVAQAPMKTKLQAAFHNPAASTGTCIDCHKAQNAKGKAAPMKCADCHKKGNAG